MSTPDWQILTSLTDDPPDAPLMLPDPPPWRDPTRSARHRERLHLQPQELELVNAALALRRPMLVTGGPGTGKSSLAWALARQLGQDEPLVWEIGSKTHRRDGLYRYDAVQRLHDGHLRGLAGGAGGASPSAPVGATSKVAEELGQLPEAEQRAFHDMGRYVQLGPLGTALARTERRRPWVVLIDEFDKCDVDLPNDLLGVLERGRFVVDELKRIEDRHPRVPVHTEGGGLVVVEGGEVANDQDHPVVVITSNGDRAFPPPFMRRVIPLNLELPKEARLRRIVALHLGTLQPDAAGELTALIADFVGKQERGLVAVDQLLNAVFLLTGEGRPDDEAAARIQKAVVQVLGRG